MKKNVIGFLLADGFEDIEFVSIYDICKRAGMNCFLFSVDNLGEVESAYGLKISTDNGINEVRLKNLDALIIPGGTEAIKKMNNYNDIHKVIIDFYQEKRLLGAICAGPLVLAKAGVLKGHKFTCYPGAKKYIKDGTFVKKNVVKSQNIITGTGPATAIEFALEIVSYFCNDEIVSEIKSDILLK